MSHLHLTNLSDAIIQSNRVEGKVTIYLCPHMIVVIKHRLQTTLLQCPRGLLWNVRKGFSVRQTSWKAVPTWATEGEGWGSARSPPRGRGWRRWSWHSGGKVRGRQEEVATDLGASGMVLVSSQMRTHFVSRAERPGLAVRAGRSGVAGGLSGAMAVASSGLPWGQVTASASRFSGTGGSSGVSAGSFSCRRFCPWLFLTSADSYRWHALLLASFWPDKAAILLLHKETKNLHDVETYTGFLQVDKLNLRHFKTIMIAI